MWSGCSVNKRSFPSCSYSRCRYTDLILPTVEEAIMWTLEPSITAPPYEVVELYPLLLSVISFHVDQYLILYVLFCVARILICSVFCENWEFLLLLNTLTCTWQMIEDYWMCVSHLADLIQWVLSISSSVFEVVMSWKCPVNVPGDGAVLRGLLAERYRRGERQKGQDGWEEVRVWSS